MGETISDVNKNKYKTKSKSRDKYPLSLQGKHLDFKLVFYDYEEYIMSKLTICLNYCESTKPLVKILMNEHLWKYQELIMVKNAIKKCIDSKTDDDRYYVLMLL